MKKNLLIFLLFLSAKVFSQNAVENPAVAVTSYKTFGYADGKRLDSIDAQYAEFSWHGFSQTIGFNYGQSKDIRRGITITDSIGNPLEFETNSLTFRLNFFYFNGWKLTATYRNDSGLPDEIILEKRNN